MGIGIYHIDRLKVHRFRQVLGVTPCTGINRMNVPRHDCADPFFPPCCIISNLIHKWDAGKLLCTGSAPEGFLRVRRVCMHIRRLTHATQGNVYAGVTRWRRQVEKEVISNSSNKLFQKPVQVTFLPKCFMMATTKPYEEDTFCAAAKFGWLTLSEIGE